MWAERATAIGPVSTDKGTRNGRAMVVSLESPAATAASTAPEASEPITGPRRSSARVNWSVDDAIAELVLAASRDAMIDVVLRFAYQHFDCVAFFIAQRRPSAPSAPPGTICFRGWDVIAPELTAETFRAVQIPGDGDHVLGRIARVPGHYLGHVEPGDPVLRALGRDPHACGLIPVMIGRNLVGVLYGDGGRHEIPLSALAELHTLVPRLGSALGKLIVRQKRGASPGRPSAAGGETESGRRAHHEGSEAGPAHQRSSSTAPDVPQTTPAGLPPSLLAEFDAALERLELASPGSFGAAAVDTASSVTTPQQDRQSAPAHAEGTADTSGLDPSASASASDAVEAPATPAPSQAPAPALAPEVPLLEVASAMRPPRAARKSRTLPSPGVDARESALISTWRAWVAQSAPGIDAKVAALHHPADDGAAARAAVCAHALDAMPSLARYFPGVLRVHPFGPMTARPPVSHFSDVTACLLKLGPDLSAPILVAECAHGDRLHRYTAVWALSEIHVPAALPRLAQRVFDSELRIAHLAWEVLAHYRHLPGFHDVMTLLRDLCRRGDPFQRIRSIEALGALRDRGGIETLIGLVGIRPKDVAEEARRALVAITGQDFRQSERKWLAWLADAQGQSRIMWLIDALEHRESHLREAAIVELESLTGHRFDFQADAARRDRDQSVQSWRLWWQTQDRAIWS